MTDVAWNGSQLVAVGSGFTTILTSPDGIEWKTRKKNRNSSRGGGFYGVAWNGSQFVVVGDRGVILSSPDGIVWKKRGWDRPYPHVTLQDVAAGGGLFVAVGDDRTLLTSPNGIAWTPRAAGLSAGDNLERVAWVNGLFVVVGRRAILGDGKVLILTSPDGVNWTPRETDAPKDVVFNTFKGVVWNGREFVVLAWSGDTLTSPDGVVWAYHRTAAGGVFVDGIAGNGDLFVTVGGSGRTRFGPDGLNWTTGNSGTSARLEGITWTGSQFVAVGDEVLTSPDGMVWTPRAWGHATSLEGVAWNGQRYIAVGSDILTSPDGVIWNRVLPPEPFYGRPRGDIIWDGARFVALGGNGHILTSPDGFTWTPRELPRTFLFSQDLAALAWNGEQFVAVGTEILTSPDGVTWTSRFPEPLPEPLSLGFYSTGFYRYYLHDVAWSGSQFVAVGVYEFFSGFYTSGLILTSPDGVNWTPQHQSNYLPRLYGVAWNGRRFAAVGYRGTIVTSPDGLHWTRRDLGTAMTPPVSVLWHDRRFIAVGARGTVLTSPNGATWSRRKTGIPAYIGLGRVAAGDSQIFALGGGETILTSPCPPR